MHRPRPLIAALLTLAVTAGCAAHPPRAGGRLPVVTAFYPLEFLSREIGADHVTVTTLTKPGAEPHDVELNPRQVAKIADAGLIAYLHGFQPAVDDAVRLEGGDRAFDAATAVDLLAPDEHGDEEPGGEHEDGGLDPHVWLDPVRFAELNDALAVRLGRADPANARDYADRAARLHARLDELNAEFTDGLRDCERREIVTSHSAFHYLAARYGLEQVGITGISPEAEPAPRRLGRVAAVARATGTTTIFFETLVSPKVAETLARTVGARTAVLDPLEGVTEPGADYFSVMRQNLAALTTALGCA